MSFAYLAATYEVVTRKSKKGKMVEVESGFCRVTFLSQSWSTMTFYLYLGTLSSDLMRELSPEGPLLLYISLHLL
jgi:hypothetical protein